MTFVTHKISGAAVHFSIARLLLAAAAAIGLTVPEPVAFVFLYAAIASGSYLGGFPDTEDYIAAQILGVSTRWRVYHEAHVGFLKARYAWIPAWGWHLFCDLFAHAAAPGEQDRWYRMKPRWKDTTLLFGLTLWDAIYVAREAVVLAVSAGAVFLAERIGA